MRLRTLSRLLAGCAALTLAAPSFAALLNPVVTAGHDQDVVFEAGLAAGATGATGELGSRQFFEDGATSPTDDGLLPTLPTFNSPVTTNDINFSFAPFSGNNILKFDSTTPVGTAKTLTLTTPVELTNLAVIFSGGSLSGSSAPPAGFTPRLGVTVNYEGGATQMTEFVVPDWGGGALPAGIIEIFNADRTTANATLWPITSDNNTTAGRWSINGGELALAQPGLKVESVSFTAYISDGTTTQNLADATGSGAGRDIAVWGLAGRVVPEPGALALMACGALALAASRRRPI